MADLKEKISRLSISEILHKAPPRLITKATETSLNGRKRPNKKSENNSLQLNGTYEFTPVIWLFLAT